MERGDNRSNLRQIERFEKFERPIYIMYYFFLNSIVENDNEAASITRSEEDSWGKEREKNGRTN